MESPTLQSYNSFILRAIILLVGVALLSSSKLLESFDLVFYDKISMAQGYLPDSDIVIVAIDENSLQILGRWPWSRKVHAEFLNRLASVGNNVVAFDLLFSEIEDSDFVADDLFGTAVTAHGGVVLPVAPVADQHSESTYLVAPLSRLRDSAALGHADVELDHDGVARRVFLMAGIGQPSWPVLGLTLVQQIHSRGDSGQISQVTEEATDTRGIWTRSHEVLIPYVGPPGTFQQISYAQILYDDSILASLSGKIILVGMTAVGMGTRFATPASSINRQPMSGVEWQANIVDMLLHDRAVYPVSDFHAGFISVSWVLALLLGISFLRINLNLIILLVLFGCGLFLNGLSLKFLHVWIPPSAGLFGTLAIYPLWNWRRINDFMHSLFIAKLGSNTALDSVGDGVITTDADNHIIYMNKGAEKILGASLNLLQGKLLQQVLNLVINEDKGYNEITETRLLVPEFGVHTTQCYLKTASGEKRAVRITRHQLSDEQDVSVGFIIAIADITDTVELKQQVVYQASHDVLTKLPTRVLLLEHFERLATAVQKTDSVVTVFFVALDNFKKINDALGHRSGDELLRIVSQRLLELTHRDDILVRWGGDEFVLLFDYLRKDNTASDMADKILKTVNQRFDLYGQSVFITASIGISFYPQDGEQGDAILERASTTMHRVKHEGGNNFGFYSQESSVFWTRDRLDLEKELRVALVENQLQVLYQPIVDVHEHRIVRMEALVRWPHPVRGLLSPGDFIPLAERVALIEQLGKIVLRSACSDAHDLLQAGILLKVSVNVAPSQLLYGDFIQTVSQILEDTALPASHLILEVTESAIFINMTRSAVILTKLRELGVSIALDDFGTGYSSLSLLRELPIDILKIDKSFILALDQNANDLTITQAIIGLGENLGMEVIAEGVETALQMQILLDQHCYLQQGYYFSRPVSYESFLELIGESNKLNSVLIKQILNAQC